MKSFASKLGLAVLLAALALSLAACGRRGPLEAPPDAAASDTRPVTGTPGAEENAANPAAPAQSGAKQTLPRPPKPFALDPLL